MTDVEFENLKEFNQRTFAEEPGFQDLIIACIDCGEKFTWTSGEQAFFRDKGLTNPPKRCKGCKQAKNARLAAVSAARKLGIKQRIEVAVNCAKCASFTTVPFYPSQGRPVYCRTCFLQMNPNLVNSEKASNTNL